MVFDLVINQFQCLVQYLFLRHLGVIQSISDMNNEKVSNFVHNHFSNRQVLYCNLSVFCIKNIKQSTRNSQAISAGKQCRQLLFYRVRQVVNLLFAGLAINKISEDCLHDGMSALTFINQFQNDGLYFI